MNEILLSWHFVVRQVYFYLSTTASTYIKHKKDVKETQDMNKNTHDIRINVRYLTEIAV